MPLRRKPVAPRLLAIAFVLSAPLWAARIPPETLSWLRIFWLALFLELLWWLIRSVFRLLGSVGAGIAIGLGTLSVVAVGIPWKGSLGTALPCRRNWGWLPSYFPRSSPTRSVRFQVGAATVKICYGSPRRRGRRMVGSSRIPYGHLWRTGANEPTTIRSTAPFRIADLTVPAGTTSLYTIPGPETWEIIVNRSVSQWGRERFYPEVADHEIGSTVVRSRKTDSTLDAFEIRVKPTSSADTVLLAMNWENWSVVIPVTPDSIR